jgi:hypothetical protein
VAKRICDVLRVAGIEVWFDQSELRGGDAWDPKIRQQIRDCALFVPIISAHTKARPEGYFRRDWKLAVDRSHLLAAEKHSSYRLSWMRQRNPRRSCRRSFVTFSGPVSGQVKYRRRSCSVSRHFSISRLRPMWASQSKGSVARPQDACPLS